MSLVGRIYLDLHSRSVNLNELGVDFHLDLNFPSVDLDENADIEMSEDPCSNLEALG